MAPHCPQVCPNSLANIQDPGPVGLMFPNIPLSTQHFSYTVPHWSLPETLLRMPFPFLSTYHVPLRHHLLQEEPQDYPRDQNDLPLLGPSPPGSPFLRHFPHSSWDPSYPTMSRGGHSFLLCPVSPSSPRCTEDPNDHCSNQHTEGKASSPPLVQGGTWDSQRRQDKWANLDLGPTWVQRKHSLEGEGALRFEGHQVG